MKRIALALAFTLFASVAWAANSSVNYTSSGAVGIRTTGDGTTNCVGSTACQLPNNTIWDSVSGANGLAITAANAAKVDGSAVTQPVSGTITANQGGTWTVQPGNTANTTPWLFQGNVSNSGSGVATSSTSVGNISYNYGFNGTTWDQLQVDGAKSLKVNCITGCSAVSIIDNSAFTYGTSSYSPVGGVYNTTITNLTSGSGGAVALTTDRNMFVNLNKIGGAVPSATNPIWTGSATASSVTMQNAAVANGNGTVLSTVGFETALVNVNCSVACSGGTTINFEGTDSTGTYFSLAAFPVTGTSSAVTTTTTSGQFWVPVSGLTNVRARISAYSAGTITVTGTPVAGINSTLAQVANANNNGQTVSASSQPVVIASDQSNLPMNLKQVNGATVSLGQTVSASSVPIVVASDQSNLPDNLKQVNGTTISLGLTTMSASLPVAVASDQTGSCTSRIAINQTASTDLLTSTNKLNICSIVLISATAQSVSLVEGTGTTCATGITALIGGTSASMSLAANGGFSSVASVPWLKTLTTADHLCLLQSSTGNISGIITYLDHT